MLFVDGHPLRESHGLRERNTTVIPNIIGPRLPDRAEQDAEVDKAKLGLMALLLFFRSTTKKH